MASLFILTMIIQCYEKMGEDEVEIISQSHSLWVAFSFVGNVMGMLENK